MLNKAMIIGHLGDDPEMRQAGEHDVANFRVATTERWKDSSGDQQEKTEWHTVVAWRALAEVCGKYLRKGSKVYVEGKLQTRPWEKDGVKRYSTEIVAMQVKFLDPKGSSDSGGGSGGPPPHSDDDVPF